MHLPQNFSAVENLIFFFVTHFQELSELKTESEKENNENCKNKNLFFIVISKFMNLQLENNKDKKE